jgi:hypothetical protein
MNWFPKVVVNALALFWVTDSISERSAAVPRSGATLDHPVYEMSSGGSHHKDSGVSVDHMVSMDRRQSRQPRRSWAPLVALDRSFRVLFVREPAPRETGTVDVEVNF